MIDYTQLGPDQEIYATGMIYDLKSLFAFLLRVIDTRKAKGKRYSLETLLTLILLANLGVKISPPGLRNGLPIE